MENYFETNEMEDLKRLYDFNLHTNLFSGLEATQRFDHADATAYTVTRLGEERKFKIELKQRNAVLLRSGKVSGKTFVDDTIIIESHKMCDLMLDKMDGYESLYINFLENGVVIIYNLNKLTKRPKSLKQKKILSKGYGAFEIGSRQGLYIYDACIYKDYKLVKRIGTKWKTLDYS